MYWLKTCILENGLPCSLCGKMSKLVEHNQLVKKHSVMLVLSGVIDLARTLLWSFGHPRPFWAWGTNFFASLWTYVQHYGRVPNLKINL